MELIAHMILHYLQAAACIYGRISLQKLYFIFSEHNPGLITLNTFCRCAMGLQNRNEPFRIIGDDDIYRRDIDVSDVDRWVVHPQYCYATWDELFALERSQEGKIARFYEREDFLQYANPQFIPDTPQIQGLKYMLKQHSDGRVPLDEILRSALQLAMDDCDAAPFLKEMQRLGCRFGNLEDRMMAAHIYKSVFETVPKPVLNGNTELDMDVLPIAMEPRHRYDSWSCTPREGEPFHIRPEQLLDNVPFTGETQHQAFLRRCLQENSLPCRLLEPCFCGSSLDAMDCCAKR